VISLVAAAEGDSAIKEHVVAADRRILGKALGDGFAWERFVSLTIAIGAGRFFECVCTTGVDMCQRRKVDLIR
jgi:hypothetical protein